MQDVVRLSLQEAQDMFEALVTGSKDTDKDKQVAPETKMAQEETGVPTPSQEGMHPQENQHTDSRLKANRYRDGWGCYTFGIASREDEESETVIAGDTPPGRVHSAHLGFRPGFQQQHRRCRVGCRQPGFPGVDEQALLAGPGAYSPSGKDIFDSPGQYRSVRQPPPEKRVHSQGRVDAGSRRHEVGVRDHPNRGAGYQCDIEGDIGGTQHVRAQQLGRPDPHGG